MKHSLRVWWDERAVGTLRTNEHGEMQFVYEPTWLADAAAPPLSLSLPKREGPFKRRECRPFFAGLLPEDVQRDGVARALGVSRGNEVTRRSSRWRRRRMPSCCWGVARISVAGR